MGRRGPKPTPTALLKMRGSRKADRNTDEPKPPKRDKIPAPSFLSKQAQKIWRKIYPIVRNMQVMTVADVNALAKYCETFAQWQVMSKFIQENGHTYKIYEKDAEGNITDTIRLVKKYPESDILLKLTERLNLQEQSFGLTPSARSRLVTTKPPENDTSRADDKPPLINFG